MNDWLAALGHGGASQTALIRVVVATVKGSAPREPGACMLVGATSVQGSIGGGHLELKAIGISRQMLAHAGGTPPRLDRFALGATLGQCCGGAVNLWFERCDSSDRSFVAAALDARALEPTVIATVLHQTGAPQRAIITRHGVHSANFDLTAQDPIVSAAATLLDSHGPGRAMLVSRAGGRPVLLETASPRRAPLWLFGAGHVGRAVVNVFADLPFDITWIDSRMDAFPAAVPSNAMVRCMEAPIDEVARAPRGAWFLVMTHSHDLDYDLCRAILARDDYTWAGLIGSETKATCFAVRFARENVPAHAIARLTCPIGAGGIRSKLPGAIAVSVAAQLLQVLQATETSGMLDGAALVSVPAGA